MIRLFYDNPFFHLLLYKGSRFMPVLLSCSYSFTVLMSTKLFTMA